MSAVDALSSNSTGTNTTNAAPNAFSSLTSESFVKIIFTELSHQDPLQPNDSQALLNQLSSLRSIQSSMDLSNSMGSLVTQNQLAAASNLIGKSVSGVSDSNQRVTGVVKSVSRTSDGAILNLADGSKVNMNNVDQVLGATS
jgi:flagellar basal-body rod modification protein FlgD